MKRMFIALVLTGFSFHSIWAELVPLSDVQLHSNVGRIDFSPPVSLNDDQNNEALANSNGNASAALTDKALNLTEGIELDINIQARLDVTYVDTDGIVKNGQPGIAGELMLSGIHIGGKDDAITPDMVRSDAPFSGSELAILNNIKIDVDPLQGMFITVEEMGDDQGNGIDIIINDIYLGNKERSAGGLLIENLSNFIQDENVSRNNDLFGLNLASVDDGKGTAGGNWVPFNMQVLTQDTQDTLANQQDLSVGQLTSSVGLPGFGANTTIDASFALYMDKVAWVDDGNEFGLAGLMVYQGEDTNGDGIDDTVGPARLTQMKLETITHKNIAGEEVQALYIENLDFKADIAIQSLYVGSPENSLGAIHIKGLDTSGTSIWIYGH
jgi:hypothetical protein